MTGFSPYLQVNWHSSLLQKWSRSRRLWAKALPVTKRRSCCRSAGDAVEDGFVAGELVTGHQTFEVDPAENATGRRRNSGDAVGMPDVRVDFAMNEFEFIELSDGLAVILDRDTAKFLEVLGSKKRRSAVPSLRINDFASCVKPQPSPS